MDLAAPGIEPGTSGSAATTITNLEKLNIMYKTNLNTMCVRSDVSVIFI
jgi:hypothetical protein